MRWAPSRIEILGDALAVLALRVRDRRDIRPGLRLVWRAIEIFLGGRRPSPRPGELLPMWSYHADDPGDTGGAYRPSHRRQDPGVDPREPGGGESSSTGSDHGWANCTMSSGADALAYHTRGGKALWGGDLRHAQGDLSGGTDLYDLRDAWAAKGETLTIRSGAGWSAVTAAHNEKRAIVIQGSGNVPGSATFDGGHACVIGIETRSSDGYWLWGDPLVTEWQWVSSSSIRSWAERWQSSIAFATSRVVESAPDPEPAPPPNVSTYPPGNSPAELKRYAAQQSEIAVGMAGAELVGFWADWLRGGPAAASDTWDGGVWAGIAELLEAVDPCDAGGAARWARSSEPEPVAAAAHALEHRATWGERGWLEVLWP